MLPLSCGASPAPSSRAALAGSCRRRRGDIPAAVHAQGGRTAQREPTDRRNDKWSATGSSRRGRGQLAAWTAPAGATMADPLTEKESQVLLYLRSMLSIAEIAAVLSVSTNTVKTHVRHVYRKLGVSRRRDAVRRPGS